MKNQRWEILIVVMPTLIGLAIALLLPLIQYLFHR
jgi:hypothetical protein